MDRANKIITDEDEKAMDKVYKIENTPRRVIGIHSRRKFKNSYEYECSFALGENIGQKNERWTPMMTADNAWIPRTEILASHAKMVAEVDQKEALASGQFRPLVRKEIGLIALTLVSMLNWYLTPACVVCLVVSVSRSF